MTDEEIVKALRICFRESTCHECSYIDYHNCTSLLKEDALAIINRQKAEIERLKREAVIDAN